MNEKIIKEYYLKAERILHKVIKNHQNNKSIKSRNLNLISSLCSICIEGQKLGYIESPKTLEN